MPSTTKNHWFVGDLNDGLHEKDRETPCFGWEKNHPGDHLPFSDQKKKDRTANGGRRISRNYEAAELRGGGGGS